MQTNTQSFFIRLPMALISIIGALFLAVEGKDLFMPLAMALIIALMLYPLHRFLENKLKMPTAIAALMSIVALVVGSTMVVVLLTDQFTEFFQNFPDLQMRFQLTIHELQHWVSAKLHITRAQQSDYLEKAGAEIMQKLAGGVSVFFLSLSHTLFLVVFILIYTFFILFYHKLLCQFAVRLFKDDHSVKVKAVLSDTKNMVGGYVLGLLTEMLVMGVANSVLLLVIKAPYALLLGVMAAVLNIVPYVGIYFSIALIMFLTFAYTNGTIALEAGVGMMILHMIDSNILLPKIVGSRVKMNSFVTIIVVVLGEFIWGIPGMFLFIPLAGIAKLIFERVEGMEPWAMVMGVPEKKQKKNKSLPQVEQAVENE